MPPRIVFMGSPGFAVPALLALAEHYPIVGVVTQPDRPAGRGHLLTQPPVKQTARALGIPVIQPENLNQPEAFQQLRIWKPDLIVVAAFGQILRANVLTLPWSGCLNLHASLLPRYRGAAPIQAAILAGEPKAGVTLMKMETGLDTGPILCQRSIPMMADETAGSLTEKLAQLGSELLIESLPAYLSGKLRPFPQPSVGSTYAGVLKKADGLLDFTRPAHELERRVRAFSPWPGTFMLWKSAPLKIRRAHVVIDTISAGQPVIVNGLPAVGTSRGLLVFDELQPAGKNSMPGQAFLAGARGWEVH